MRADRREGRPGKRGGLQVRWGELVPTGFAPQRPGQSAVTGGTIQLGRLVLSMIRGMVSRPTRVQWHLAQGPVPP